MNPVKFFIAVAIVMTICNISSCNNNESSNDDTLIVDQVDGYTFLSSLNIENAKTVFKISDSPSGYGDLNYSSRTYWKIDTNGNISRLVFTGEDGTVNNIRIDNIIELGSRFLYVTPNTNDLLNLHSQFLSLPDYYYYCCIVDKTTGKIYPCSKDVNDYSHPKEDIAGNVLFKGLEVGEDGYSSAIYKLDITNFSVTKVFSLNNDTYHIWDDLTPFGKGCFISGNIVRLLNGDIIRLDDDNQKSDYFVLKSKLYKITDNKIYICEVHGNSVSETEIDCAMDIYFYNGYTIYNTAKDVMVFRSNNGSVVEFDGEKISSISLSQHFTGDIKNCTRNFWWEYTSSRNINIVSMLDYSVKNISVQGSDYEVTNFSSNSNSDKIAFYGFKLNGGEKIIGSIDISGKIDIMELDASYKYVVDLIPLN